jgi:hypothetical protein
MQGHRFWRREWDLESFRTITMIPNYVFFFHRIKFGVTFTRRCCDQISMSWQMTSRRNKYEQLLKTMKYIRDHHNRRHAEPGFRLYVHS